MDLEDIECVEDSVGVIFFVISGNCIIAQGHGQFASISTSAFIRLVSKADQYQKVLKERLEGAFNTVSI
jgi:hypothetical protein